MSILLIQRGKTHLVPLYDGGKGRFLSSCEFFFMLTLSSSRASSSRVASRQPNAKKVQGPDFFAI
jgi:hypothetical protein